jgi:hypothetical protein
LALVVGAFTGIVINDIEGKYEDDKFSGIVISAVDNMETRQAIWDNHKGNYETELIIDPRMAGEYATIYAIDPNDFKDQEMYEKTLFTDKNAVEERCTAKSTMYTVLLISGLVSKIVKDKCLSDPYYRTVDWNIKANSFQGWKNKDL